MQLQPALFVALLSLSTLSHAQLRPPERPTPEAIQKMTDSTGSLGQTAVRVAEMQLEAQLRIAGRRDTAETVAAFKKNLFDALREKGFTAEQSLQIVIATPVPSAAAGGK
jgi:hypothetical protein